MPLVHLTTFIAAPAERVFDLSRSIDLHTRSMSRYREEPVAGRTSGLIGLNETVGWKAKHFGKMRSLTSKITAYDRPIFFKDEQVEGDFKNFRHEHYFKKIDNGTIMIDQFYFELPYGNFGKLLSALLVERYITRLLMERNRLIKSVSESDQWKQFLHE